MPAHAKNQTSNSKGSLWRFILLSIVGLSIYFLPVDADGQVPMVILVNLIKRILGNILPYVVTISSIALLITFILSKVTKNKALRAHHKSDKVVYGILYVLAALFPVMVLMHAGPAPIIDENVGGLAISIAQSSLITILTAGSLIIFIIKSGIVEFIGIMIEPIMRPLFKLPGEAAVNAITSFVAAPAVGVYFTSKLYEDNIYTEKECIALITNFSVCSIGFFGVLVAIGNVTHLYSPVVVTTFIITFIMSAIVIRIPPISRKRNVYKDKTEQTKEYLAEAKARHAGQSRLQRAVAAAIDRSGELTPKAVLRSFVDAAKFTQKIVAFILAVSTLALLIAEYTPIFDILGKPMVPYLNLLGIQNASEIASCTIIGLTDMTLPVMLAAGKNVAESTMFFVIVLSAIQVIFFSESANAMLEVDVPLSAPELILHFFIRTIIAMPLIAIATKLLF